MCLVSWREFEFDLEERMTFIKIKVGIPGECQWKMTTADIIEFWGRDCFPETLLLPHHRFYSQDYEK